MVENHHSFTDHAGSSEGKELERELRRLFKGDFTSLRETGLLSEQTVHNFIHDYACSVSFVCEGINLRRILD